VCDSGSTPEHVKMAVHLELLKRLFGHASFRGPQASAILHWGIRKKDAVVVWRTGGGKTVLFALTACVHPGITVVVLPLISLIDDMQRVLVAHHVRAAALHSLLTTERIRQVGNDLLRGRSFVNVLLVTPEAIVRRSDLRSMLAKLRAAGRRLRFVIDEAHCISDYGGFRPAYRHLHLIKEAFPEAPLLALTGTATRDDAVAFAVALKMRPDSVVILHDTARYDIAMHVERRRGRGIRQGGENLVQVLQRPELAGKKGIVFSASCNAVDTLASILAAALEPGRIFKTHAGMAATEKAAGEAAWARSANGVIVATSTLGMGVNVPGCTFTVHYHMPSSLTTLQQEAGRSSRAGEGGHSIVLLSTGDERLWAVIHAESAREEICASLRGRPGLTEVELRKRASTATIDPHRRLRELLLVLSIQRVCPRKLFRLGAAAAVSAACVPGPSCPTGTCARCGAPAPPPAPCITAHARLVLAVIAELAASEKPCTVTNVIDVACCSQRQDVQKTMADLAIYRPDHAARRERLTPALTGALAEYIVSALIVRGEAKMSVDVHESIVLESDEPDDDEIPRRRKITFSLANTGKPLAPLYYHA
jgi:RecQ family ATP-dependent DNA helicase